MQDTPRDTPCPAVPSNSTEKLKFSPASSEVSTVHFLEGKIQHCHFTQISSTCPLTCAIHGHKELEQARACMGHHTPRRSPWKGRKLSACLALSSAATLHGPPNLGMVGHAPPPPPGSCLALSKVLKKCWLPGVELGIVATAWGPEASLASNQGGKAAPWWERPLWEKCLLGKNS